MLKSSYYSKNYAGIIYIVFIPVGYLHHHHHSAESWWQSAPVFQNRSSDAEAGRQLQYPVLSRITFLQVMEITHRYKYCTVKREVVSSIHNGTWVRIGTIVLITAE